MFELANKLQCQGIVDITLRDKYGNIKETRHVHNRIVDTGLELIASLITGKPNDDNFIDKPTCIGIGSDNSRVQASDTKLLGHLIRKNFSKVERKNNNVTFTSVFLPGEPNYHNVRIGEVGLYNASTGGTLFNRCVFGTLYKEIDDELTISITITINGQPSKFDSLRQDDTPVVENP